MTPDKTFPLLLLGGVIIYFGYKFISPIKKSVARITNACIEIQTVFENSGVPLRHHLVEAPGSPLQPTEYGKQLIEDSGLTKILNDKKDFLKTELNKILPPGNTEYDVQEKARELLLRLKNEEIMTPVKKYAYDNGLNVDIILKTGGLWLRDDFLSIPRKIQQEKEN